MKTIVEINNNNYGSTGNIMMNIARNAREKGYDVFTCAKNSIESKKFEYDNQLLIGVWIERVISEKLCYLTGYKDCFNILGTLLFIEKLKKIKPDLIHLHNIHGSFLNISLLFKYINKNNIPVVWTLHDAWAFTGQCTNCEIANCDKWQSLCLNCQQINIYPASKTDRTTYLYKLKKQLFTNIKNLTIVTPSIWLSSLVKKSYLQDKKTIVINNGINLDRFKYTNNELRSKYHLEDKFIIIGVAFYWNNNKGLDTFIRLANELPSNYQIVLVGTNDEIDKLLPNNIISIHKTNSVDELICLYSMADLFVNPTLAENFPTVNIESLACGTPVLTYDTGGAKEMLDDTCGTYVNKFDYDSLKNKILYIAKNKPYKRENCILKSKQYAMHDKFNEYIDLYNSILK